MQSRFRNCSGASQRSRNFLLVCPVSGSTAGIRSPNITDMGPHELWVEPCEGPPEEEADWEWDLVDEEEDGPTKNAPDGRPGWKRWYFIYHQPCCTNVKISSHRDPL